MRARILHRTAGVSLSEVRCDGGPRHAGPDEESPATQIVLVRRGLFVRSVAREIVVAEPTRALFFRRGEGYRTAHPVEGGDLCTVIAIADAAALPSSAPTTVEDDLAHRRLLARLPSLSPLEADEAVIDLAQRIVAQARRVRLATPSAPRISDRARQIVAARFDENLRLDKLASALGCSPFHLCRTFRRDHDLTLGRFQTRLRVRAALERISDGERDLTQLALALGFYDHSHLCRAFRRELRWAPSTWRNFVQARRLAAG